MAVGVRMGRSPVKGATLLTLTHTPMRLHQHLTGHPLPVPHPVQESPVMRWVYREDWAAVPVPPYHSSFPLIKVAYDLL